MEKLIEKNSKFILCKNIKIDKGYKNVLSYTESEMLSLCNSSDHLIAYKDNYSFIKDTGDISVKIPYSACLEANYIAFQNSKYSNKWFFAFIENVRYKSDLATEIEFSIDIWSTWFSNWTSKEAYVLREHVSDDSIGLHTIPEGIETGEYISNEKIIDDNMSSVNDDLCYIISASAGYTATPEDPAPPNGGDVYNGIYSGTKYYRFDTVSAVQIVLELYANHGQLDTINGIFIIPKALAPFKQGALENEVESSTAPFTYDKKITKQTTLNGYSPKNNKLLCYPYNYLLTSNNAGSSAIYHYELFSSSECDFKVKGVITPSGSIRNIPLNYRGAVENDEYAINFGKYPICSYQTDMYTNWLTQNSINILGNQLTIDDINMSSTLLSAQSNISSGAISGAIEGFAKGGKAGAIAGAIGGSTSGVINGFFGIVGNLMSRKQHELIAPQTRGNLNSGDVMTSDNKNTITYYKMSIKSEYAKKIDDYFSRFGYQINEVKKPNIKTRPIFNFILIGEGEDVCLGEVPNQYSQTINEIARKGVTIWHNHENIGNYSLNNK